MIGCYSKGSFTVNLSQIDDLDRSPYYYVHCVGISKKVRAEHVPFVKQLVRKEYNRLELDCGGEGERYTLNYQEMCSFF